MRVCGAHMHVCICGATLWFVFFLCRWFCPFVCVSGSVSFPCRDGLVMHGEVESGHTRPCLLWFLFHSIPCCGRSLSISISLLSFNLFTSPCPRYLRHFCVLNPLHLSQVPSICLASVFLSLSLFPCHSFTTSISSAGTPE